jgi:hypothetical protein
MEGRWWIVDGRWKMEDGRWKMEDGRWKMEGERRKAGGGVPQAARMGSGRVLLWRPMIFLLP